MPQYEIFAPERAIPDHALVGTEAEAAVRAAWRGRDLSEWTGEPCIYCAGGSKVAKTMTFAKGGSRVNWSWPEMRVAAEGNGWHAKAVNLAAALDAFVRSWPRDWRCEHKDCAIAMRERVKARLAVADWEWRRGAV